MSKEVVSEDWKQFRALPKLIKNKEIRDFTESFIDEKVPEYFKHIPASSSGKYHPSYALGEGGLLRHVIAATHIMVHIVGLKYLKISSTMQDKMIAAIICHDTFKQGLDASTGHTTKDHEKTAAEQISGFAATKDGIGMIGKDISSLVLSHGGEWCKNEPATRFHFLVHLADYLASRKDLYVDFNIPAERRN